MNIRIVPIAVVLILIQTACLAQNAVSDTEAFVSSVRAFVEKEGEPHLIIADVSNYRETPEPVWKKYGSIKELEDAREEEESYTVAFIWQRDGKPAAVNFSYSSPSGDWAHYVEYVFRPDGSVAGVRRELRTFLGELIVIRTSLFDEKGNELKATTEFQDLETQKPVPQPKDFQDIDVPVYRKAGELPFFSMAGDKAVNRLAHALVHGSSAQVRCLNEIKKAAQSNTASVLSPFHSVLTSSVSSGSNTVSLPCS